MVDRIVSSLYAMSMKRKSLPTVKGWLSCAQRLFINAMPILHNKVAWVDLLTALFVKGQT